jgi:hypothetical protein
MSPARRARERSRAASDKAAADDDVATAEPIATPLARPPSIAQRHRDRHAGARAADVAAEMTAANDNDHAERASPYDLMRLQLATDQRSLKALKSVEKKIELKRQLLPNYAAWCEGVLAGAAAGGEAAQDEVVTTIMVWRIDAGDFAGALQLAEHVLKHKLMLPERYNRDVSTLLVDEFARAALAAFAAAKDFPAEILDDVEILTAAADIHDQARAKLFKARGLELVKRAEDPADYERFAGGRPAALAEALTRLQRAIALDPQVGVKKDIERLERELKKDPATPPREGDAG